MKKKLNGKKSSNFTQRAVSDDQIVRKPNQFRKLRLFLSLDHIVIDQMFSRCRNDCIEMIGVNNMTLYKKITVERVVWKEQRFYDFKKKTDSPTTHQRDSSPYKPNPLQFIRPAQNQYSPKSAKKIVPAKSNHVSK